MGLPFWRKESENLDFLDTCQNGSDNVKYWLSIDWASNKIGKSLRNLLRYCTAFVRLNGPPPGAKKNTKFLKAALNIMFKDNYAKHFTHSKEGLNVTSKVVTRITNGSDQLSVLPCFYWNKNIDFFCTLLLNILSYSQ